MWGRFAIKLLITKHNLKDDSLLSHDCIDMLRCGIIPLHLETGRNTNTALEIRLCEFCDKNVKEKQFILSCSFYNDLRKGLYLKMNYAQPEFQSMLVNDRFCVYVTKQTASSG